jgi:hypothetical protein
MAKPAGPELPLDTSVDGRFRATVGAGGANARYPVLTTTARCTYRVLMLRLLMLIAAAIVIVWIAVVVIHFIMWLFLIGLILFVVALALGVFRVGRRSARRSHR